VTEENELLLKAELELINRIIKLNKH